MKKIALSFLVIASALVITRCSKGEDGCRNVTLAQDSTVIANYFAANAVTGYTKDANSGVWYKVINPGTSPVVTSTSRVAIKYKGNLLDAASTVFDDQSAAPVGPYPATGFIPGFQVLLSKIAKGGQIDGYIPSNWAYGCQGVGTIPANACLHFNIELIDVL